MRKKNILIGLTYYMPNISGITQYASILADELIKRKYTVNILTSKHQPGLKTEEMINEAKVTRISGYKIGKGIIMPMYLFRAIKLVKQADIVNCHLPAVEGVWLGILSKLLNKTFIVTYQCYFDANNLIVNKAIEIIHNLTCNMADKIIVNSKDYIEGYNLLGNYREKIYEIFPPIKVDKVKKEKKQINILGFLGRISKEKNIEILIEAMNELKKDNYYLELAGPEEIVGEKKYQDKIMNLIKNNKNIKLVGKQKNIASFLSRISCLILPSNNKLEAFGMVQLEAMSMGTPCVVTDLPGIRVPIKTTGMGKLFENNNVVDLVNKIREVMSTQETYQKKSPDGLKYFEINYFMDKYLKALED